MQAPVSRARSASNEDDDAMQLLQKRTEVMNRFASALSGSRPSQTAIANFFSPCLNKDSIALTIPSLELELPAKDEEEKNKALLPTIGEHHNSASVGDQSPGLSSSVVTDEQQQPPPRPSMTASVLSHQHTSLDGSNSSKNDAADPSAAQASISRPISWTQSTLAYATAAVSSNLAQSFQSLTDSRLKSWTLVVLRHSLSTGSAQSRSRLMRIVSTKIQVHASNTGAAVQFKTLPLPASAQGLKPKDADCILPLLFEVEVNVGTAAATTAAQPVLLRCPGTISCSFGSNHDDNCKLASVNVSLDTDKMMKSMVDQARLVVLKAVSSATNSTPSDGTSTARDDSLLRSSLNLSNGSSKDAKTKDDVRAMKARSSALRLNSILQGKPYEPAVPTNPRKLNTEQQPLAGLSLGALAPVSKKPRLVQTANRLKSFKSFGRPHAGDFGSGPRNATFGEFGGHGGSWGRNGRLAEHPQPMHLGATPDKNETFAAATAGRGTSSSAALLMMRARVGGGLTSSSGGMKRSPTALEHSLLQKYGR